MKAGDILREATSLVEGDRADAYGDCVECHTKMAAVVTGILTAAGKLSAPLDAHDMASILEGVKIARRYQGVRADNATDAAAYAAIAGEIQARG
jgi:hypothetical protein